ncbi:FAR1 DNA-binding domain [Sesbania bispinosa]|nr:FAR1 DNA-binding domain [Sesbania bispinosa]
MRRCPSPAGRPPPPQVLLLFFHHRRRRPLRAPSRPLKPVRRPPLKGRTRHSENSVPAVVPCSSSNTPVRPLSLELRRRRHLEACSSSPMDNNDDEYVVHLDNDNDPSFRCSVSADDSTSEEDYDLGDNSEPNNVDATEEEYKKIIDLTVEDISSMEFCSETEVCEFYTLYAKLHGFVMRKDDVARDYHGNLIMRQLVCNREGRRDKKHFMRVDRKRAHRPITRTKCEARLRVHFDYRSSKWKVVAFEESHNHELTPPKCIHLISAYRKLSDGDKAQAQSLHSYGVRTCHIMGFMLAQKGGMVRRHGLEGNRWVCKTYENKQMWATAYLRDIFFGRIRTTSQCEGINSLLKSYVKKKNTLVDFLHNMEQVMRQYRNNELVADFKDIYTEPVITTSLYELERHASKIFTLEIFREVKSEIEEAGALVVNEQSQNGQHLMFQMSKFRVPDSEIVLYMIELS